MEPQQQMMKMRRPQPSYKKVKSLRAENAKPKKQTARTVELKPIPFT
jgi:hypothetical protein